MPLEEIIFNFDLMESWEDRYRYVIELGRMLPPLDDALKTEATKVRGCASRVWLVSHVTAGGEAGPVRITFQGDSDAHIVRGLIAILLTAIADKTAAEIAAMDIRAAFADLGLNDNLTPQRSNGLAAMIERVRAEARATAAGHAAAIGS